MLTLVALSCLAAVAIADDCTTLDIAGVQSVAKDFDFVKAINGQLTPLCCGKGKLQLGALNLGKILSSETEEVDVIARYRDEDKSINLVCTTTKKAVQALSAVALSKEFDAASLLKLKDFEIACKTKDESKEILRFKGSELKAPKCNIDGSEPEDPEEPEDPNKPPEADKCDDLQKLIGEPIKFLFGANVCLGDVGRFVLDKVDLSQLPAVGQGDAMTVSGQFVPQGQDEGFKLSCEVGSALSKKLLSLAKTLDTKSLDLNSFREVVDLRCVDANNQHLVTIDKDSAEGLSVAELKQTLKIAGVNVNTFKQVYRLIKDTELEIGDFKLVDGKIVYPGGEIEVETAIDFISDKVAVTRDGDKVIKIVTPHGVVVLKDGSLSYIGKDGAKKELGKDCEKASRQGGALIAVCGGKKIAFRPGFLVDRDGKVEEPNGMSRKLLGAFQIPEVCAKDDTCRAKIEEAFIAAAKKKGCEVAIDYDNATKGKLNLSCKNVSQDQADLIVDDILLNVNAGKAEDEYAIKAAVSTPEPTSSSNTLVVSCFAVLLSFFAFTL